MKRTSRRVLLPLVMLLSSAVSAHTQTETIITKQETDMIFGIKRSAWEAHVRQMIHPKGWRMRLMPQETGTGYAAFDPATGVGLSVQPLFPDETNPPDMIIVGSWYPIGRTRFTPAIVADIEKAAQRDLGPGYSVSAKTASMGNFEGVELMVTRKK
jgi:hypothetical protein